MNAKMFSMNAKNAQTLNAKTFSTNAKMFSTSYEFVAARMNETCHI